VNIACTEDEPDLSNLFPVGYDFVVTGMNFDLIALGYS